MNEWKEIKLGDICEMINGFAFKGGDFMDSGVPVIKIKNVKPNKILLDNLSYVSESVAEDLSKYLVKPNDILLTMSGNRSDGSPDSWVGKASLFKLQGRFLLNQRVSIIRVNESRASIPFIAYNLSSWQTQLHLINQANSSGGQANISPDQVKDIDIILPPLKEQNIIAEVLSSLDDKIDLLHRQNKTLEQLAETLFRNVLNSNHNWIEQPLSILIETTLGGEWGKDNPEGEYQMEVCCIRGTDIADLQTGIAEKAPIRYVKEKKFNSIQPVNGDLILEISGGTEDQSTGRTIYISELNRTLFPHPIVFSNFCRLLRPKKEHHSYFLYLYIQYLYKNDEFFNLENGSSGIKNLDYKYLINDLKFLLPVNEKDILDFNESVSIYFEKINKNKHQILVLTKLRDALLPRLMSGDIKIK